MPKPPIDRQPIEPKQNRRQNNINNKWRQKQNECRWIERRRRRRLFFENALFSFSFVSSLILFFYTLLNEHARDYLSETRYSDMIRLQFVLQLHGDDTHCFDGGSIHWTQQFRTIEWSSRKGNYSIRLVSVRFALAFVETILRFFYCFGLFARYITRTIQHAQLPSADCECRRRSNTLLTLMLFLLVPHRSLICAMRSLAATCMGDSRFSRQTRTHTPSYLSLDALAPHTFNSYFPHSV